jgi:hypothetical protein
VGGESLSLREDSLSLREESLSLREEVSILHRGVFSSTGIDCIDSVADAPERRKDKVLF